MYWFYFQHLTQSVISVTHEIHLESFYNGVMYIKVELGGDNFGEVRQSSYQDKTLKLIHAKNPLLLVLDK